MEPVTHYVLHHARRLAAQLRERAQGDAGYSTETVIITALLAALGIGAVAIITTKVMAKARGIDLGG
jgi:preprotein translocase subunit SecA